MDNKKIPLLALAPMAGFTDAPFRLMCYKAGCDIAVTEMISAKAMTYRDKKTGELARLPLGDSPTAIQLFGHEPSVMAEAAVMIERADFEGCDFSEKPAAIDINMGCPVKKIALSGDGSALMKDPDLCRTIVFAIKNAVEVARACAEGGASVVAVHARTREELYNPGIDMDIISRVRDALPPEVLVFGNGDVTDGRSALEMAEKTGCDGIMIGREALGNPWIFDEIKAYIKGEEYCEKTKKERNEAAIALVAAIVELKGEDRGIREARGRAAHFIRGLRGSADIRAALNSSNSFSEFVSILNEWE